MSARRINNHEQHAPGDGGFVATLLPNTNTNGAQQQPPQQRGSSGVAFQISPTGSVGMQNQSRCAGASLAAMQTSPNGSTGPSQVRGGSMLSGATLQQQRAPPMRLPTSTSSRPHVSRMGTSEVFTDIGCQQARPQERNERTTQQQAMPQKGVGALPSARRGEFGNAMNNAAAMMMMRDSHHQAAGAAIADDPDAEDQQQQEQQRPAGWLHHLPVPCTSEEIRLLSPLAALKEHFDALRILHDRGGENIVSSRVSASTVILRASLAMAFHHIDALLLNPLLVVVEDAAFGDALRLVSELWRKDDVEHLQRLAETIDDIDGLIRARSAAQHPGVLVRLSRLSSLWLLLTTRDTHFSTRIITIGLMTLMQLALLIVNVATGSSTQLIVSILLFFLCFVALLFLTLLVQHATTFSHVDILRTTLAPDVEWLHPDDLVKDAPITLYRKFLLFGHTASGAYAAALSSSSGTAANVGGDFTSGGQSIITSHLFARQRPCLIGASSSGPNHQQHGSLDPGSSGNAAVAAVPAANTASSSARTGATIGGNRSSGVVYGERFVAPYQSTGGGREESHSQISFARIEDSFRGSSVSAKNLGGGGGGPSILGTGPPPSLHLAAAHAGMLLVPALDMVRQRRVMLQCDSEVLSTHAPLIIVDKDRGEIVYVSETALEFVASTAAQLVGTKVSRTFLCDYLGPAKPNSSCRPVVLRFLLNKGVAVNAVQCAAKRYVPRSTSLSGGGAPAGGGAGQYYQQQQQQQSQGPRDETMSALNSNVSWSHPWTEDGGAGLLVNFGGGSSGHHHAANAASAAATVNPAAFLHGNQHGTSVMSSKTGGGGTGRPREERERHYVIYLLTERSVPATTTTSRDYENSQRRSITDGAIVADTFGGNSAHRISLPPGSVSSGVGLSVPASHQLPQLSLFAPSPKNQQQQPFRANSVGDRTTECLRKCVTAVAPSADIRFSQTFPALATEQLPTAALSKAIRMLLQYYASNEDASSPSSAGGGGGGSGTSGAVLIYYDHEEPQDAPPPSVRSGGDGPPMLEATSNRCVVASPTCGGVGAFSNHSGSQATSPSNGSHSGSQRARFSTAAATLPIPAGATVASAATTTRLITLRFTLQSTSSASSGGSGGAALPSHRAGAPNSKAVAAAFHEELAAVLSSAGVKYAFDDRTQTSRMQWPATLRTASGALLPGNDGEPLQLPTVLPSGGINSLITDELNKLRKKSSLDHPNGSGSYNTAAGASSILQYSKEGDQAKPVTVLMYSRQTIAQDVKALKALFDEGAVVHHVTDVRLLSKKIAALAAETSATPTGSPTLQQGGGGATVTQVTTNNNGSGGGVAPFELLLVEWDPMLDAPSVEDDVVLTECRRNVRNYLHAIPQHVHATFVFSRVGMPPPPPAAVLRSAVLTTEWDGTSADELDAIITPLVSAVSKYQYLMSGASSWDPLQHTRGNRVAETYVLGRRLGAGGFGDVFEVKIDLSDGVLAMKRIFLQDDAVLDSVRREVKLMASLEHQNLVRLSHCTMEDQCVCLFMELCDSALSQHLRPNTNPQQPHSLSLVSPNTHIQPLQLVQVANDVVNGLRYLHAQGVAHRDLKPENILFRNGVAKISDFGSAARQQDGVPFRNMKGTLTYMAPEVILGEPYGRACDMWSMGCILAEILGVPLLHLHNVTVPKLTEYYASLRMDETLDVQEVPQWVLSGPSAHDPLQDSAAPARPTVLGGGRSPPRASLETGGLHAATGIPTRLTLPSDVVNLLRSCFARDPAKRVSAEDLLAHPVCYDEVWMAQMRIAVAERIPKEFVVSAGFSAGGSGGGGNLIQFHSMDMSIDSLGAVFA